MPDDPIIARTAPAATGSAAYIAALVLEGSTPETAVLKRAPVSKPGFWNSHNLPAGNNILTFALMRSGVLTSTYDDPTSILIPLLQDISDVGNYSFNPNDPKNPIFCFERVGLGGLFINGASGVTISWNGLDPATAGSNKGVGLLRMKSLNNWVAM